MMQDSDGHFITPLGAEEIETIREKAFQ